MNQIVIMGRLTRDPERRETKSGLAVTSLTLAVDRGVTPKDGGGRQCDFINVVAWRNTADFAAKYFVKGQMAAVTGRLEIREWTDKDNNKRRTAEVIADRIYFTESKKSREASVGSDPEDDDYGDAGPDEPSDFAELEPGDGDLPF
jgi:single-strand DNA-binding protein